MQFFETIFLEEVDEFMQTLDYKSQISKLENHANSATIETIFKVFKALKAEIQFNAKVEDRQIQLA